MVGLVVYVGFVIGHKRLHGHSHHGGVRQHQHVRHGRRVRGRHQHREQPRPDSVDHGGLSRQVETQEDEIFKTEFSCRMDMFFHIASIERDIYWQLGNVTCSAYPLRCFNKSYNMPLEKRAYLIPIKCFVGIWTQSTRTLER